MKKLIIVPLLFFCLFSFGQYAIENSGSTLKLTGWAATPIYVQKTGLKIYSEKNQLSQDLIKIQTVQTQLYFAKFSEIVAPSAATAAAMLDSIQSYINGGTEIQITDGAGVVNTKVVGDDVVAGDVGLITHSMIHGETTGGGGGYVDVKVNPSGALTVEAEVTSNVDFNLEVGRGNVDNVMCIQKFGEAPNGIQTTATDIWTRADATPTQQVWLAPTAARIHKIVSNSASDDGNPVGVGARTIRIWGLKTWDTAETSEDITLDGTDSVSTQYSYVIIHRMKVLTSGATSINVGTIVARAVTDYTITAVIGPGDGQTEMAIYGVPSTQDFYLTRWGVSIDKAAGAATTVDFVLRVNENPNVQTTNFIRKSDESVQSTGTSSKEKIFKCYPKFAGPCIIKVQGIAANADTDGHAEFDGYIVTR